MRRDPFQRHRVQPENIPLPLSWHPGFPLSCQDAGQLLKERDRLSCRHSLELTSKVWRGVAKPEFFNITAGATHDARANLRTANIERKDSGAKTS